MSDVSGALTVQASSDGFALFTDRSIVAMRVNGELRDLAHVLTAGDVVEPVAIDSADGLNILRHSAAHVLAQAVQNVNPDAKLGIGPPVTDGFYYDFDVEEAFTPEDMKALEKAMSRIVRAGQQNLCDRLEEPRRRAWAHARRTTSPAVVPVNQQRAREHPASH